MQLKFSKKKILKRLWLTGNSIPRGWVYSTEILKLTGQKYFDRRIRELRDECGIDIGTGIYQGKNAYRLKSLQIQKANPRRYLTAIQKARLFQRYDNICPTCGKRGTSRLQADHKIPLIRGGKHNDSNWQPLCNECNVAKRSACTGCNDDCTKCPWAYPQNTGIVTMVRLPLPLIDRIRKLGLNQSQTETLIIEAVSEFLAK
jgi:hypothetical protein